MKKQVWGYLLVAVVIMSGTYFVGRVISKGERDLSARNLMALQDTIHRYQIKVNGLTRDVFEKKALVLSLKDAIKTGVIEKEYWRKLHMSAMVANVKLEGELKAAQDSLDVPPEVQYITVNDSSGIARDYIKIPFKLLDIKQPHLVLGAGMDKNRKAWYNLSIPVVGTVTVGYKGKTAVGVFASENPLLTITNMNIVINPYKQKWYEKWYITGPAGFVGGIILGTAIKK